MNTTDDLTGTYVLVNPGLQDDPVNKQGQAGLLTYADAPNDDFYVSFGKEQGLYAGDALLSFRKPQEIYDSVMEQRMQLDKQEIKDLYRIGLLLNSRQVKDQKTAMDMVLANPKTQGIALQSLDEKLGRFASIEQAPEMVGSRGR